MAHKIYSGKVVSISGEKTIAVEVVRRIPHERLKKYYNRTTRFLVHDELSRAVVGEEVSFVETRPISKRKAFKLVETSSQGAS